ncbi:MAG: bifunctional nuclease family protein [Elusimicrobiales bacterium]|nr:bifunctional nuclease family protein [Elusimicrobiales bacterium]
MKKEIEVKIYSIASSLTESIVFLEEIQGIRILPIWIGPIEAQAIAIKMSGYPSPRPMTHDLLYRIISQSGMKVEKIVIDSLKYNTFFSKIYIKKENGDILQIDARPSDAIALAVRVGCSIYVASEIFEETQVINKPISEEEVADFKEKLKNFMTTKDILGEQPKREEKDTRKENEDEQKTDNK